MRAHTLYAMLLAERLVILAVHLGDLHVANAVKRMPQQLVVLCTVHGGT